MGTQYKYDIYPDYKPAPRRKKKHPVRTFLKITGISLLILLLVTGIAGLVWVRHVISGAPDLSAYAITPTEAATYICDEEGNRIRKLTLPEANRDLVTIDRIPVHLQYAFVAIEDSRFYTHDGIDLQGIVRAAFAGITRGHFSEGASTITQQLLKNTIFTDWTKEQTFYERLVRKIQEQYLALQLEKELRKGYSKSYAKSRILEDYLNVINLGAGCYGVQSAAYRYFGKDVSELTLSECAVIAGITQNPTRYNPITNPGENAARRKLVLQYMRKQRYITQEEYEEALADEVYARIQSNEESAASEVSVYTYYQDALIDQVIQDLQTEKGYTYKQAFKAVYSGGLRIYSAQDDAIQQICDEEALNLQNFPALSSVGIDYALSIQSPDGQITHYGNDDLRSWIRATADPSFNLMFPTREQAEDAAQAFRVHTVQTNDTVLGERVTITPQPQASITVIDQATGYVKALIGGRGAKEASLTLNRASYTLRQPGSTFKILAVFAPALDQAGKTLATVYENTALSYDDGTPVGNWDLNDFGGTATIREAIVRSINVVAVRCLQDITPRTGYDYVRNFGITSLTDGTDEEYPGMSDVILPLALGGITKGVTNLELCAAYACIAGGGRYHAPKFYTAVTDHEGNIILDNREPQSRTVLKETTAWLLTDAMRGTISDAAGTAHDEIDLGSMPAAGKTGTTNDYRDIWFAGYTPYYTCCVWGGYDNNAVLPEEGIGHTFDKVLWNAVMTRIHEELPVQDFPVPANIISAAVCPQSGLRASSGCPEGYSEYFAAGTAPEGFCSEHGGAGIQPAPSAPGTAPGQGGAGDGGIIVYTEDEYSTGQGPGTYGGQTGTQQGAGEALPGTGTAQPGTGTTQPGTGSTQTAPVQTPPGALTLDEQGAAGTQSDTGTQNGTPAQDAGGGAQPGVSQPETGQAPQGTQDVITIISNG